MALNEKFSPSGKSNTVVPVENEIVVYGTSWCGMTQMIRRYLDRMGVSYRFIDIDEDPAAVNQLRWITGGYASHPTVIIDGQTLVEPSVGEVSRALTRSGYIA